MTEMISIAVREFRRGTGAIDVVLESCLDRFRQIAEALLQHDGYLIDGHTQESVEGWGHLARDEEGLLYVGRFDRVTRAPDGLLTLVDYKKKSLPKKGDINGASETPVGWSDLSTDQKEKEIDRLGTIQLPFYIRLIEAADEHGDDGGDDLG